MAKDKQFWESAALNNVTYRQYYYRLTELAISVFKWNNLPDTVDERFMELALFTDGKVLFFRDDVGDLRALRAAVGGQMDMYRIPRKRNAYADNGFHMMLDETDSVLVYNNMLRLPCMVEIESYARRLYNLDRIIDVNANAQKTPILITCEESQRLTMTNLYKQYDGNTPVINGDKNINPNSLRVLQTGAPYVADKIYTLKTQIWNEALTYLGIPNVNVTKKERLITDEVDRSQGGTMASRYSKLLMRQKGADEVNKMFGTNITVEYRQENETDYSEGEVENNE